MANKLLNKPTELNNILKDYSIIACTNSYILNYQANRVEVPYSESVVQGDISKYLELSVENRINNFKTTYNTRNEFNFSYTYFKSNTYLESNSIIISNLSQDELSSDTNSYVVFYNTDYGIKQLTYHYKEGNGFYYDDIHHIFGMNIDNNTIKEINKKLFFDTNSIPISSKENYGIGYVDTRYLKVNNGILTIESSYIENVISYKYKIKNLFQRLTNIYNSLSYYNSIYENKNDVIDEFTEKFSILNNDGDSKSINTEISYHKSHSLYFPISELKYIDNYYFENGLINEKYKQYITLDENNSYIIYCKDIEKLDILSYISNDYINYGNVFNVNKIKQIESNLFNNSDMIDLADLDTTNLSQYVSDDNKQEILSNNNIYSYIYSDETNNYNKFIIRSNIVNNILYSLPINTDVCTQTELSSDVKIDSLFSSNKIFIKRYDNDFEYYLEVLPQYVKENKDHETFYKCLINSVKSYQMTKSKFRFSNKFIDEKLFKKLGIILNSKISLPEIKKNIIRYTKNGNTIQYDYTIQNITCKYDSRNIKILYDDREITYCTYNTNPIPYDKDVYYFLSNYDYNSNININESISFMLKNTDISFDNRLQYLFYGYSWTMRDYQIFNKNYYGIWHDLPTYYITSNFMKLIISMNPSVNSNSFNSCNILLDNFKELYTENFNEIEFNKNDYHSLKLYLYKISKGNTYDQISKVNNVTINI